MKAAIITFVLTVAVFCGAAAWAYWAVDQSLMRMHQDGGKPMQQPGPRRPPGGGPVLPAEPRPPEEDKEPAVPGWLPKC